MTNRILKTLNEGYGFFGTCRDFGVPQTNAWRIASEMVATATQTSPEGTRLFLDSVQGRHFADDVCCSLPRGLTTDDAIKVGIEKAIAKWNGWTIGPRLSRETGIPAGLPYLNGWLAHYEIAADEDDGDAMGRMMGRNI